MKGNTRKVSPRRRPSRRAAREGKKKKGGGECKVRVR